MVRLRVSKSGTVKVFTIWFSVCFAFNENSQERSHGRASLKKKKKRSAARRYGAGWS